MSDRTYNDLRQIIEAAISDGLPKDGDGHDAEVYVSDMTDAWAVYQVGYSGDLLQVSYSVDDGGAVTLGDPIPVIQSTSYEPADRANASALATSRSAARSRRAGGYLPIVPPTGNDWPTVKLGKEPLTYERHMTKRSFFADVVAASRNDERAQARLNRHAQEMRTNPNRTDGQGGYFSPPAWLIDEFATAPRAKRVLAELCQHFDLPSGVSTINVPRLTTGNTELPVADLEGVPDTDIVDAACTSSVVTIAGESDVALQLLEQSAPGAHFDWVTFKDLTEAYDAELETQLFNGNGGNTGTAPQLQGIFNATGINKVTYTSGSPSAVAMWPYFGQAMAQIGDARSCPPEFWFMRSARWAYLASSADPGGRPLDTPDPNTPGTGALLGVPIKLSDGIPATLGASANQDVVVGCIPSDLLLFESEPHTLIAPDVLSGTLSVRLRLHRYVAAITGRYPSGIATIGGTGFVVQSGF